MCQQMFNELAAIEKDLGRPVNDWQLTVVRRRNRTEVIEKIVADPATRTIRIHTQ